MQISSVILGAKTSRCNENRVNLEKVSIFWTVTCWKDFCISFNLLRLWEESLYTHLEVIFVFRLMFPFLILVPNELRSASTKTLNTIFLKKNILFLPGSGPLPPSGCPWYSCRPIFWGRFVSLVSFINPEYKESNTVQWGLVIRTNFTVNEAGLVIRIRLTRPHVFFLPLAVVVEQL